jgi:hypothetical protein
MPAMVVMEVCWKYSVAWMPDTSRSPPGVWKTTGSDGGIGGGGDGGHLQIPTASAKEDARAIAAMTPVQGPALVCGVFMVCENLKGVASCPRLSPG